MAHDWGLLFQTQHFSPQHFQLHLNWRKCLFACCQCLWSQQQHPLSEDRKAFVWQRVLLQQAQGWDHTSPFIPISHTGFTALINWFHLPLIWQENFLITFLSPLRTWITHMLSIKLLFSLHLLKAPHFSRGQALSLASGKVKNKGMAWGHSCKAQCFSFLQAADNLLSARNIRFSPAVNPTCSGYRLRKRVRFTALLTQPFQTINK